MTKSAVIAFFTIPSFAAAIWGETLTMYAGVASNGTEAAHFPAPEVEQGRHEATVTSTRRIVPSAGLPNSVVVKQANNNLDAVNHLGRVFLAFRTAKDHFAGNETIIQVVSSEDELHWQHEAELSLATDLREPRFLSYNGKLFLYVSKFGTDRYDFEPKGVLVTYRASDGTWSDLAALDLPGHIVWRTKMIDETPLMTAYVGGENIYNFSGEPLEVKLLTTENGLQWKPLLAGQQTVYRGGGSETAVSTDDDGNLYAVMRNEAGDQSGWGSSVCFAAAREWTNWDCVNDPKKYDSPAMFSHDGEIYLVARRNLSEDGHYDQQFGPDIVRNLMNQLDYVTTGKRCSLWRYDKAERRVAFVLDLPSKGDTCFPAVVKGRTGGEFIVYNYSSPIHGADMPWSVGQRKATFVYRHVLNFRRQPRSGKTTSL